MLVCGRLGTGCPLWTGSAYTGQKEQRLNLSDRKKWFAVCAVSLVAGIALVAVERVKWSKVLGAEGHYFNSAGVRIHYTDDGEGAQFRYRSGGLLLGGAPGQFVHDLVSLTGLSSAAWGCPGSNATQTTEGAFSERRRGECDSPCSTVIPSALSRIVTSLGDAGVLY